MLMYVAVVAACFSAVAWCRNSDSLGASNLPQFLPGSIGFALVGLMMSPIAFFGALVGLVLRLARSTEPLFSAFGFGAFAVVGIAGVVFVPLPPNVAWADALARVVFVLACIVPLILAEAFLRSEVQQMTRLLPWAAVLCSSAYLFWWGNLVSASV